MYKKEFRQDHIILNSLSFEMLLITKVFKGAEVMLAKKELERLKRVLSKLWQEFKLHYDNIPWAIFVQRINHLLGDHFKDISQVEFQEFLQMANKYKEEMYNLSLLKIKENDVKMTNDYKYPIKTSRSIKPVKK